MLVLHISSLSLKCGILYIKTATYMGGANSDTFKLDNGRGEAECIIVGIRSLLRHGTLLYPVKRTQRKRHGKRPQIDLENVQNLTNSAFGDNDNIIKEHLHYNCNLLRHAIIISDRIPLVTWPRLRRKKGYNSSYIFRHAARRATNVYEYYPTG